MPLESRSVSVPSWEMTSPVSPASSSSPAPAWRAMPKSTTRGRCSLSRRTLSGLKSRWTNPAACAAARPRPAAMNTSRISRHERGFSASQLLIVPPATNSIARNTWSSMHADVVNGDDVRVLEARDRLCLAQQARPRRVLHALPGLDQLEGDLAIELRIVRAVDDAHRAGADALDDHVTPDPGARVELAGCHARGSCVGATVLHVFPPLNARAESALCRTANGGSFRYSVFSPAWRPIFHAATMRGRSHFRNDPTTSLKIRG